MRQLLLATKNPGKIKEIKEILKSVPFELKTMDDIGYKDEIQETGNNFEENAIIKAKMVGENTGLLTLSEDSGLEVYALDGKPGVNSARYTKGSDLDRINKLLRDLIGVPKEKRLARFKTVVAIYNPISKRINIFEGENVGYITEYINGDNGFGYDPVFFNLDLGKTNAQATLDEKNKVSHRAQALTKAIKFLKGYFKLSYQ